jgi:hypothetical protein
MAISTTAPIGQRLVAAFIALFCILAAAWLLDGAAGATWYGTGLAVLVLCSAFVLGHVAFRGKLPGRFLAGGNAFIGGVRIAPAARAYGSAPVWQRVFYAAFVLILSIEIVSELVTGGFHASYHSAVSLLSVLGAIYVFGHVALRGCLPTRLAGGGNTSLQFHSRRNDG